MTTIVVDMLSVILSYLAHPGITSLPPLLHRSTRLSMVISLINIVCIYYKSTSDTE